MNTVAQTPELCKVFFDRSARQYIVRNGREIARFPSGPENKTRALWAAIAHDDAQLHNVAREMLAEGLADEGRLIRAARLVIEGKIIEHTHDDDYTRAQVEASEGNLSPVTGLDRYHITYNMVWSCTCADHDRHGAPHRCKHSLAVEMVQRRQAEVEAAGQRKWADKQERRQTVAQQRAEARAGLGSALKSQQPAARIGSLPTAWQFR